MRILACSDVRNWEGFDEVITEAKPDILAFAGDLVSDGYADFWGPSALAKIPGFTQELNSLIAKYQEQLSSSEQMRLLKVRFPGGAMRFIGTPAHGDYETEREELEWRYRDRPEFQRIRRDSHVERFYQVLEFASKVAGLILVVRGDHDDDFPGEYDVEKINGTKNSHEISGRSVKYKHFSFLGLGYHETRSVNSIRHFAESEPSNFVITHAQERRMPDLARLRTRVILRGHFRSDRTYGGAPVISTHPPVLIEVSESTDKLQLKTRYFLHPKPREIVSGESHQLLSKYPMCTHCGTIQEKLETHLESCPLKDSFEI